MPPEQDSEVLDTEVSQTSTDTTAVTDAPSDETTPSSSDGETTDGPSSLEEAVLAALDGPPEAPTAEDTANEEDTPEGDQDGDETPDPETSEGEEDAKSETETDPKETDKSADSDADDDEDPDENSDPSQEELDAMRPKQRKRVQTLLRQRAAARRDAQTLRPDAEQYQKLRTFMQTNDLQDAEVADLFMLGADLKSGDPARLQTFLDKVMPFVTVAQEALGQVVPADMREQVETGEITEDAAREVAKNRRQAEMARAQLQRTNERTHAAEQARTAKAQTDQMSTALSTWMTEKQGTDPDFANKQALLTLAVQGLVAQRGHPKTPEQTVAYANEAYDTVSNTLRPKRQPTRPTPTASASPTRSAVKPEPTSLDEVIMQGLQQAG